MAITVIQRRDIIRSVLHRWTGQYRHYADEQVIKGITKAAIVSALAALDLETCSQQDVDAAIGASGWAKNECDVCDGDFATVIRIGAEPDCDVRWQDVCLGCLTKAVDILSSTKIVA